MADKPGALFPPYASEDQQALKAELERRRARDALGLDARAGASATSRPAVATGFDAAWDRRRADARRVAEALAAGTFHTAGGMLLYLVAGRK